MASPNLQLLSLGFMLIVLCMHHCSARKVLMEDMNKQEKSQLKDNVKPVPMAHEDVNKQEKSQPKDDIKPTPMAHEDMNKQKKAQPKDDIKPAPMAHEDMSKQEKGQPTDDFKVKPAPMAHETDHGLAQKNNKTSSKEGEEIGLECGGGGCESPCFELPCNGGGGVIIQPPGYVVPTPPIVEIQPPHIVYPPPVVIRYPPFVGPTPCTPCEPWYGPGPCPCPCEEGYNAETKGIMTEGEGHDDESNNKAKESEMKPFIGIPASSNAADAPMPAIIHGLNVHA